MENMISVYDKEGNKIKEIELPEHFKFEIREDIVYKVFRAYISVSYTHLTLPTIYSV